MKFPENTPTKIDLDIADMKDKIANIMETLSSITSQSSTPQQRETFCSTQCTVRHSTPMSSPPLYSGSKLGNVSLDEHSSVDSMAKNSFSLFLTNIDGNATEQEVSSMVAQSLHVDDMQKIEVSKLVAKWKMHLHHPYVSLKVTLDERFKRTALQPETWPTGILFREFIERPRRIWIPVRQERIGRRCDQL